MTIHTPAAARPTAAGLCRTVLAGAAVAAAAVLPAAVGGLAPPAGASPSTTCPVGESNDLYTDVCVADVVPNSSGPRAIPDSPGGGTFKGVPCTSVSIGTCIGLRQNEAPAPGVGPRSPVRSSP